MKQGYLLYAFNTEQSDYVSMATYNAKLIKRYANRPVALVTDTESHVEDGVFDYVIRKPPKIEYDNLGVDRKLWRNTERTGYLDDTPFERTLVIDADYLVYNDRLNLLLDLPDSLVLSERVRQVSDGSLTDRRVSGFGLNTIWATCFVFSKTPFTHMFFQLVDYVRSHYNHFASLYDFSPSPYRNDFAFSIAAHLVKGQDPLNTELTLNPYPIAMVNRRDHVIELFEDGLLAFDSHVGSGLVRTKGMNVHVLSKDSLLACIAKQGKSL